MRASSASTLLVPLAATAPNSLACPRSALIACVCCFTSNSRTDRTIALACVSADFTGTKVMPGRNAPSQIASASMWSFLPRLTNGLAYCGGINRTRCPTPPRTRPQWCDPPHASSTTSVGGSLRKNVSTCSRRSSRRSTTSPRSSTPCKVNKYLDVSIAISLSSLTDGLLLVVLDDPTSGTRCRGAVHTNSHQPGSASAALLRPAPDARAQSQPT